MSYPTSIPMNAPAFQHRPQMMPPQPQPMRPMYGPTPQPIKVNGRAGADAYYMGPNETAVLFDENADVFFFKTTDGAGYPTTRAFSYAPLQEQTGAELPYATKEELETLRKEIADLKGALSNGKQSVRAKVKPEPEE